jgi:pullulanase
MGIHDINTMNRVSQHLQNFDPTIFVYGEGWKAGSSPINDEQLALKMNVPQLKSVAAFSDEIRDGIKGSWHDWEAPGFVSGNGERIEGVKFGITGGVLHDQVDYGLVQESDAPWAPQPSQCIVYASCHDNHTLYDKLKIVSPEASEETILKQHILANTIVLTSQGIPFLHAGVDFVRTKKGVENSYDSPDSINQIDWSRKSQYKEVFNYYKALIALRKSHPVFRMDTQEKVSKNLTFLEGGDNMILYTLNGAAVNDSWKQVLVVFNGNATTQPVDLPAGNWRVELDGMEIATKPIEAPAYVDAYSAMILVKD